MRIQLVITFVLLVALSSAVLASESYRFDQSRSTIGFTVHQFLGTTQGKFTKFDGKIDIDREHPEFFNIAKFPEMTFKSRGIRQTGQQSGDILGELTMHGITKPITLHVKLLSPISGNTKQTRWAVTTEPLKRSDFKLMFSQGTEAISGISQTVAVNIEIEASRVQ